MLQEGICTTPLAQSQCAKKECFLEDYDEPRVAVAGLPGNASALTTNVDAIPTPTSSALTPTSAALAGGLTFALQRASANVEHAVLLVLLTDGAPTRCPPYTASGMASFISAAYGSASPVRTFVVGLLTPQATALTKPIFDDIASAGGTNAASIVSTNAPDVAASLRASLDAVRNEGACVLKVPAGDPGRVSVRLADGSAIPLAKKAGASACDASGGWYFDGATKKILMCPTTCATVKGGTKVETVLACP